MKLVKIILEIFGWLWIAVGVTLPVMLILYFIYSNSPTETLFIISAIIVSINFIIGATFATRIWIKHGTIEWLSNIARVS